LLVGALSPQIVSNSCCGQCVGKAETTEPPHAELRAEVHAVNQQLKRPSQWLKTLPTQGRLKRGRLGERTCTRVHVRSTEAGRITEAGPQSQKETLGRKTLGSKQGTFGDVLWALCILRIP